MGTGTDWSLSEPADSPPAVATRHLRPFQLSGLRFDGVETAWRWWRASGGQLSAPGYREQSLSLGAGLPGSGRGWIRGELFHSGPASASSAIGGIREQRGAAISGGLGLRVGPSRWELSALDVLRAGDVDLPPLTWRVGLIWSARPTLGLAARRSWEADGVPRDRLVLRWEATPGLVAVCGADDGGPVAGMEVGGGGVDVSVTVRSHQSLAPTTALALRLTFGRDGAAPEAGTVAPTSGRAAQAPAATPLPGGGLSPSGLATGPHRPFGDVGLIDAPAPWELEPEEADLLDRDGDLPDSLSVWELRVRDALAPGLHADRGGGSVPLAEDLHRSVRTVALRDSTLLVLPVPVHVIATLHDWPGVEPAAWSARRAAWARFVTETSPASLADLALLPQSERAFWTAWIPYLVIAPEASAARELPARGATGRIESRLRIRGGEVERRETVSAQIGPPSSRWTLSGLRSPGKGVPRASLRARGEGWSWRAEWGSERARPRLAADLSRAVVADGGFAAGDLRRGSFRVGARVATNGGDLLLSWKALHLGIASHGLREFGLRSGAARLEVVRAPGAVWFLRSRQEASAGRVSLRFESTERAAGGAAATRSDPRALRFERRVGAQRPVGSAVGRVEVSWRSAAAEAAGFAPPAASETREIALHLAARPRERSWSTDVRVRRTSSRAEVGNAVRSTAVSFRQRGGWWAGSPGPWIGWEVGMRGTYRTARESSESWLALYREERTRHASLAWGICELRSRRGGRATLDPSWSPLPPRSVRGNTRWAAVTATGSLGLLAFTAAGIVPLGFEAEEGAWELRVAIEPPFSLLPRGDPR